MEGAPAASFSRKLIESFVEEDRAAPTKMAGDAAPAAQPGVGAGAAVGAGADGAGGPILLQYAAYLGMDVVADSDLLWIAQQALTAELPPGWSEHADPMSGDPYCTSAPAAAAARAGSHPGCACPCARVRSQTTTPPRRRPCGSTRATSVSAATLPEGAPPAPARPRV